MILCLRSRAESRDHGRRHATPTRTGLGRHSDVNRPRATRERPVGTTTDPDREGESLTDGWLNILAGVLAFATAALCVVTAFLWWSTRKLAVAAVAQGRDMKRSLEIAADAVRANSDVAAATKLSADATASAANTAK